MIRHPKEIEKLVKAVQMGRVTHGVKKKGLARRLIKRTNKRVVRYVEQMKQRQIENEKQQEKEKEQTAIKNHLFKQKIAKKIERL